MSYGSIVRGCLGKKPVRHDPRTLMLSSLMPELPPPPPARDWTGKLPLDIGMYRNDVLGDCTCASAAHLIQVWTSQAGMAPIWVSESDVVSAYSAIGGYDPTNPASDGGCVMLDVLNYWRKTGIGDHRIGAYVKVDHSKIGHVQAAIDYFGAVYVGANLPLSARDTDYWLGTLPGVIPHGTQQAGSWGGHCMGAGGYDRSGVSFLTWGKRQRADWLWWLEYVDECYAIVSTDWIGGNGLAPVGLDIAKLNAFLGSL